MLSFLPILLQIIGISIIICGILIAILAYSARQDFIGSLSNRYLANLDDDDIVPNEVVVKVMGSLIRRVLLIIFATLFIETAGFALLVVSFVL